PITTGDLRAALRVSPGVDAALRASSGGRAFSWSPQRPLNELTQYTVSLASRKDSSGHQLMSARWRFTTTIVPRVVSFAAEGGAALPDQSEIPSGSRVSVGFNDRMDTASVRLLGNGKPVSLTWAGDGRSALVGGADLPVGRLELSVATGSRDSEGRLATLWTTHLSVVFHIDIHTVPLRAPALVQVPNATAARDQSGRQDAD